MSAYPYRVDPEDWYDENEDAVREEMFDGRRDERGRWIGEPE